MKIKTILVILLAGTLLASCHGDLNIIQKSEVSANSMWQDEGDATSAMYGMFNKFRATFSTGYIYWGEYRTDKQHVTKYIKIRYQQTTVMQIGLIYIQQSTMLI